MTAPPAAQFVRFVISGGITTAVDFGALTALLALGVLQPVATSSAFLAAALVNYVLHRRFTFRTAKPWSSRELFRFACVLAFNMTLTSGLIEVMTRGASLNVFIAKCVTIPLVMVSGFLLSRRFVFVQEAP